MATLSYPSISSPEAEFLVIFSVTAQSEGLGRPARRTVRVLARTAQHAKRICRLRYPRARHVQVMGSPRLSMPFWAD